jgi:hypothetical protein
MTQVSDDEVSFLTQGDPQKEDVVLSLWHDRLKLLVVTDGEKGCRYFTKALFLSTYFAPHNFLNDYNSSLYSKVFPFSPHLFDNTFFAMRRVSKEECLGFQ